MDVSKFYFAVVNREKLFVFFLMNMVTLSSFPHLIFLKSTPEKINGFLVCRSHISECFYRIFSLRKALPLISERAELKILFNINKIFQRNDSWAIYFEFLHILVLSPVNDSIKFK